MREAAREHALVTGADEVYHPDAVPKRYLLADLSRWREPVGGDVVIETAGVQASLDLAGRVVRAHGVMSILAYHQDGPRRVDMKAWNYKAIDVINAHARHQAYQMACMR